MNALPDCTGLAPQRGLLARQEREIVRLLAEEGPAGLEAWLREEEQRDPDIRGRVEDLRRRLEREARARRRALDERHAGETEATRSDWERQVQAQAERERARTHRRRVPSS